MDRIPAAVLNAMERALQPDLGGPPADEQVRDLLRAAERLGWKLCPADATVDMVAACAQALKRRVESLPREQRPWFNRPGAGGYYFTPREKAEVRWRAMWQAAPNAEQSSKPPAD